MSKDIFEDLFVLELANNHWGRLERGLRIIEDHARIVRFNNVRAAIKLQLRDVPTFVHKDFVARQDIRYVKKTLATQISSKDLAAMARAIRENGCIPMATPFDERSVDLCVELGIQMLKIASSDTADWFLIERMAQTRKPMIVSTSA
jgi:sialic acid synthase SpsE